MATGEESGDHDMHVTCTGGLVESQRSFNDKRVLGGGGRDMRLLGQEHGCKVTVQADFNVCGRCDGALSGVNGPYTMACCALNEDVLQSPLHCSTIASHEYLAPKKGSQDKWSEIVHVPSYSNVGSVA